MGKEEGINFVLFCAFLLAQGHKEYLRNHLVPTLVPMSVQKAISLPRRLVNNTLLSLGFLIIQPHIVAQRYAMLVLHNINLASFKFSVIYEKFHASMNSAL